MKFLYWAEFSHPGDCENWIAAALNRGGHYCTRVDKRWVGVQDVIGLIRTEKPDVVLVNKVLDRMAHPSGITIEQWIDLRLACPKLVYWTFDWFRRPDRVAWFSDQARVCDAVFMTDGYQDHEFWISQRVKRHELHQGIDQLHHRPIDPARVPAEYRCDVAFIGSIYTPQRVELDRRLKRYDYRHYGYPGPEVWGRDFQMAVAGARIVVGDNFTNQVAGYWSDRVYLTLGCGGFFIASYVEGLEREFTNGEHLAWYRNLDELDELIRRYLDSPEERNRIRSAGCQLVHGRDTYDHRIAAMTRILEGR